MDFHNILVMASEQQGLNAVPVSRGVARGEEARRGGRPARPRARRQAGDAVASSRTPASPLCLLWREQAADWPWASTVLGRQVGCQVSSFSAFCFSFYLFLFYVLK